MSLIWLQDAMSDWAALSEVDMRPSDNALLFASSGGEIRFQARKQGARAIVTRAERAGPESFCMSSDDIVDVAKYLTGQLGVSVRSKLGLRFLMTPVEIEDTAAGWSIAGNDSEWVAHSELTGRRVIFRADYLAVAFTHYGDRTLDELRASYLDPEGRPYTVLDRVL